MFQAYYGHNQAFAHTAGILFPKKNAWLKGCFRKLPRRTKAPCPGCTGEYPTPAYAIKKEAPHPKVKSR